LNDAIVRSLAGGVLTIDGDGRIASINPAGLEMLGATSGEVVGEDATGFLPVEAARVEARVRLDGHARRRDGSSFPIGLTASPLVDDADVAVGTVVTFQDLTEIRALRGAAERAERLATLGRRATGLAHEIRNPLCSISGSVEMVREATALGDEDRRLLGIVLRETDRLDNLVDTMLRLGRPTTLRRAPTDVSDLAREVTDVVRAGPARSAEVEVILETPSTPPASIDPDAIRQVLWNLLMNAIQASPKGASVSIHVGESSDGDVELSVRDRGRGIPEPERDRLFEVFYTSRPQGVGLGLALVRQIVEAHRGRIEIESELGAGSCFRVSLPARGSDPHESDEAPPGVSA
jgi:two-component system sensor histidine kinase PilS (NtrC family)